MSGKPKAAEKYLKTSELDKPVLETSSDVVSSAGLIVSSGVGGSHSSGGYGVSSHSDPISTVPRDPTPPFPVSGSKGSGSHKHKKKKKHKHEVKGQFVFLVNCCALLFFFIFLIHFLSVPPSLCPSLSPSLSLSLSLTLYTLLQIIHLLHKIIMYILLIIKIPVLLN